MYNSITESKIKKIPQIGEVNIDRLPQELTRIYAQIVSIRRQFSTSTLNFQSDDLLSSLQALKTLANNLETVLITVPNHENIESIAFVAGTAQSLIYKMGISLKKDLPNILEIDTISPIISAVILFLIGNSQADAAEMADKLYEPEQSSSTQKVLVKYIKALAKGKPAIIINNLFREDDINVNEIQGAALDYLWREIGIGIYNIASKLTGILHPNHYINSFDRVIELSVSEDLFMGQKNIFTGPYHLAKLLKILEADILSRAAINIPTPKGINPSLWQEFLGKLSQERPFLWENHKNAVDTNFLDPGISAVLTLPTGAGKTTLSELKIATSLFSNKNVIYLVPTHALEDQVNKNLRELFPEHSPLNIEFDGEFTDLENIETFPIFVMTPERCLTLQNMNPEFFETVGLVVFDEFHLIHGKDIHRDRRAIDAMHCLISLFNIIPNSDYLLISAMVENGGEIVEWIQAITGRECKLFNSSWKPTRQLHGCLIFEEKDIQFLKQVIYQARQVATTTNPPVKLKNIMKLAPHCFFSLKNIWETNDNSDYFRNQLLEDHILLGINNFWGLTTNRNDIAAKLGIHFSKLGLKTLIFVDNPKIALSTAKKISDDLNGRENCYEEFLESNNSRIESLKMELGDFEHSYFQNQGNVGVHHGLLLPIERILIEQYFKPANGAIALVATATLAQGINLPAEIVIIAGDDRFDEGSQNRERIPPHELLNAAGRAGRAGQSSQGAVILIPGEIVTIEDSTISNKWWDLKNDVFSKSDQCLKIQDPLEYFLDSIQDEAEPLNIAQTNILFKFKSDSLSEIETKKLFKNSFYAFKAAKEDKQESFNFKIDNLLKRRNQLDSLSEDITWTKEISYKSGVDPSLILLLSHAIDKEDFDNFIKLTIIDYISWLFSLIQKNSIFIDKLFTKQSTINQIKKAVGIKPRNSDFNEIGKQLTILNTILIQYVKGDSLKSINQLIPGQNDTLLTKARNFVVRLVPDLSFSFGLLSMIVIEKAKQKDIDKKDLSRTIRNLARCIREGFDDAGKLNFKMQYQTQTRVETHIKYSLQKE